MGQSYFMGSRCLFTLGWPPFQLCCHSINTLRGRRFSTPSSPIGLVKTESDYIVRSFETDLGT